MFVFALVFVFEVADAEAEAVAVVEFLLGNDSPCDIPNISANPLSPDDNDDVDDEEEEENVLVVVNPICFLPVAEELDAEGDAMEPKLPPADADVDVDEDVDVDVLIFSPENIPEPLLFVVAVLLLPEAGTPKSIILLLLLISKILL
jgi:hypothetical protein